MKCPKCGYLGFDEPDRCRNCGYEFVLSAGRAEPELTLRDDREVRPIGELDLKVPSSPTPGRAVGAGLAGRASGGHTENVELPLFTDDIPLITKASPPRAPLSVRRATPEVPRLRSEAPRSAEAPRPAALAFHEPEPRTEPAASEPTPDPAFAVIAAPEPAASAPTVTSVRPAGWVPAGLVSRWFAAGIDLLLLAAVDVAVLYFTLQICGLTADEWRLLPRGPLLAFLAVQNGGYLVAFTAGGQTIGKMLTGIKVIAAEPGEALDLGRALQRTMLWTLMALPGGLGLLSALLTTDRRGLHDRVAGTKVVRASA